MRKYEGSEIDGRYRLARFLDEGAFGAVFRAVHMAYGVELREVAVKVAKKPMTDVEARRVFHDALIMTRVVDTIADTNVKERFVTVHDAGRCPEGGPLEGHPYMVMELVPGISLKTCLAAGPFPLTRTIAYFDQILEAVAFMHRGIPLPDGSRHPVVHRDLKPANILVVRRKDGPDRLKVTDFGLAVETDALLGWVETGGTLAFMAPESFSHNLCSPQSDVYMLGLVAYEMLTGVQPFKEVGAHLRSPGEDNREEIRRLHLRARQCENFALLERQEEMRRRPELARAIRTALAPDMTSRTFRNAGDFLAAWEEAKRGRASVEEERPWEAVRRLTEEADQCFAAGDAPQAERLLEQALEINRDPCKVPDRMVVGKCYLLAVERRLRDKDLDGAARLAHEAHRRRPCRSAHTALARIYEVQGSPLASAFYQKARECRDGE